MFQMWTGMGWLLPKVLDGPLVRGPPEIAVTIHALCSDGGALDLRGYENL